MGEAARDVDATTEAPPIQVVATAGHVDHGKSTLLERLTGIDPDRLAEEKRRGLTIDLGFAWCTLPSGREIGFVDVPGHERFVRNMLAGVGPVRLVLFVVAADEGWKPQSEEHLQIVDVLGVDGAVIALTKRDLVDEETLGIAEDEARERVAGTALEGAPIVACSGATGEGLDELRRALDGMVAEAPTPEPRGRVRQYLDRVFTIRGAGTVVTGTLTGGALAVGDEIELYPLGTRARVRGLQTHKRQLDRAVPVSRVAVNLAGIEKGGVERGAVLGRPGEWRPTSVFEARVRPVRGLERGLPAKGAFKVYTGSAERDARIRFYEGGFARIRLSQPLVLDVYDRFVLREAGRRATVAGGEVLDTAPPVRPGPGAPERLARRERASRSDLPAVLLAERGAVREREIQVLTGVRPTEIEGPTRIGTWWVTNELRAAAEEAVRSFLHVFHRDRPLLPGAEVTAVREHLTGALRRRGLPATDALAEAIVDELAASGVLLRDGATVRLAEHDPRRAPSPEVERAVRAVEAGEPTPPPVAELLGQGIPRDALEAAVASGALVRISRELVVTKGFVERAIEIVRRAGDAGITVSAFRDALATSRKFAVPLLEHLDAVGATRRRGDLRFARATVGPATS
jgi:selenocysteine-specific elongation factor